MLIVKVKKFGVVWYIPFEMTAKSDIGIKEKYRIQCKVVRITV